MRLASYALLAAFAAGPLLAAKPPAVDSSDPRELYRERGESVCVAELRTIGDSASKDIEAVCGCALDRFMPRWPTGALPPLDSGRLPAEIAGELQACAAQEGVRVAAALDRPVAELPPEERQASGAGSSVRAWLDGLPGRLAGLPIWVWPPIALFILLLLRALFRRDSRRDLIGPPRHMRPGARSGWPPGR